MKVILKQTVPKVGKEGSVVTVKDGFARNFLFPRGMAVLADKTQMHVLEKRNAKVAAQLAETKADADALREKIHGADVRIEGKVGKETGKLFGAITSQDIADAIKSQLGVTLEKKQIGILQPIKRLGTHNVEIDAHRQVDIKIHVHVFDPESVEEEKPAEPEAAAPAPAAEPEPEEVTV